MFGNILQEDKSGVVIWYWTMKFILPIKKNAEKISRVNPWLLILLTAPLPLILVGYMVYKWSTARTDYTRVTSQMIQRQNTVLAQDAMTVARDMSFLLETIARDIQTLSLVPPTPGNFLKFYLSRISQVTQIHSKDDSVSVIPLPLYPEIIYLNAQGDEILRFRNGKQERNLRKFSQCQESNLCDPKLIQKAVHSPVGELYYGRLMRWYSPEGTVEQDDGSYFPVVYRSGDSILLLGIDYRYFKDLLSEPTFPYERKRNLLQAYQNGNYIYFTDSEFDFVAHPKHWHVTGIDRTTGRRALPMKVDSDEGSRPLNIVAYQGDRLREYFERLRTRSFLQKNVDIFEAPNLKGTSRVLSVAPILLSKGQFQKSGVFGYVVLGCNVDYFEEPREQYVPYY